jgi:hypothetical protein
VINTSQTSMAPFPCGRRHVVYRRPDGSGWVTLTDPEAELCRLRGDSEFSDPYAHLVT